MKKIAYLGFVPFGSFGDDICWYAISRHPKMQKFLKENDCTLEVRPQYGSKVSPNENWDYYIMGSGTCITSFMRPWADEVIESVKNLNKPYSFFGTGVLFEESRQGGKRTHKETEQSRQRMKEVVENARMIAVRDEGSANFLKSLNPSNKDEIVGMGDGTFTVNLPDVSKEYTVGFNFAVEQYGCPGTYIRPGREMRQKVLDFLKTIPGKKLYVPFNYIDKQFIPEVKNSIECDVVPYSKFDNINDICTMVNKCETFIGERVHADILSMTLNVPFLSITYTEPNKNVLDHIDYPEEYRYYMNSDNPIDIATAYQSLQNNKENMIDFLKKQAIINKKRYVQQLEHLLEDINDCIS